ncbi:MAG: hypothetical protein ACTTIA_04600, partial [Candidatus Cryptobacteroides sp.]
TGAIHGVNFPKPLDKAAIKARIAERNKKAIEAEKLANASVKPSPDKTVETAKLNEESQARPATLSKENKEA